MAEKSFESLLSSFFFLFISFSVNSVSAQVVCSKTIEIFKPNSPSDHNRRLILSTLASNVTAHGGYFNGSSGLSQDRVYAMGMCSPGAEPDVCSSCIKIASESLLQNCLNETDAFTWQGEEIVCLVRYSRKLLSGVLGLYPDDSHYNYMDIAKEYQKEFDSVWDGLMSRVIREASSSVKYNFSSSSLSSKYYAKDKAAVPVDAKIFALMQCTPDVSSKDCQLCLQRSVDLYKTQFRGKRGSRILRPSCFVRWEFFSFSGAFDNINDVPSAPPPNPTSLANLTNIRKNKKGKSFLETFFRPFLFF